MQHPKILDPIKPTGHSTGDPITPKGQTADLIRGQVETIVASRGFVRSVRMIRFLRFAVDQAILRREETLKEHLIGIEVFDRKPCYDAGTDPIVRVEARRLRNKLRDYYQEQGQKDLVRIDFPVGSYVPVFHWLDSVPSVKGAGGSGSRPCPRRKAIAVLPFLNLSPDRRNEYLRGAIQSATGFKPPFLILISNNRSIPGWRGKFARLAFCRHSLFSTRLRGF